MLRVPVGTQVRSLAGGKLVADLDEAGKTAVVARGGLGGRGNAWFARAEYRAPRIAQRGGEGEEVDLQLDLKLLADIGIVGLPNAGKSTLLRAISAARPRVAEYPFTTLEPVLGVVEVGYERFVVADIPGLVEGAHAGVGLGLDFLRHVERTRVLIHLLDGASEDPLADMDMLNGELHHYSPLLAEREQIVVVNKVDLPEVRDRVGVLETTLAGRGAPALFISAAEGDGTADLVQRAAEALRGLRRERLVVEVPKVRPRPLRRRFEVRRDDGGFSVVGERIGAFAAMMPVEVEEGRQELWWRLGRWGVSAALRRAGARPGDRVRLGGVDLEWPG